MLLAFPPTSSKILNDSFSIPDEDPLSESGLYTTTNYYNYVDYVPASYLWLYSKVVSNTVKLLTQGKHINSGARETWGKAYSISVSKINNYYASTMSPIRTKAKVRGDTRLYTYNVASGSVAGFTVGKGIDPSTKIGLWISIIHTRVTVAAGGQRISLIVGTTPFSCNILSSQTLINESSSPENTDFYVDFLSYPSKVSLKIWKTTDTEPSNYTDYNYTSSVPSSKNEVYIGQKCFYEGYDTMGGYTQNPIIHYLDNLYLELL